MYVPFFFTLLGLIYYLRPHPQLNTTPPDVVDYLRTSVKPIPEAKVHFLFAMTNGGIRYLKNIETFHCYARLNGDRYRVNVTIGNAGTDHVHFARHKFELAYMETIPENDWVALFDGDHTIVNFNKPFYETYIKPWKDREIIMRERFQGEITASSLILKNTPYTREFLREWANLPSKRPDHVVSMHNTDNGPLHYLVLARLVGTDVKEWQQCPGGYPALTHRKGLEPFVNCVRWLLNSTNCKGHDWDKFKFFGRFEGWAHDGWIMKYQWDDRDFAHHAVKTDLRKDEYDPRRYPNDKECTLYKNRDIYYKPVIRKTGAP
ncbi:MAG: DUF273 domain-containing protein, partial [Flavobacteriales bacterium]|nr:DUF273 domain-containing protein [Flavobacteriales bacterium]